MILKVFSRPVFFFFFLLDKVWYLIFYPFECFLVSLYKHEEPAFEKLAKEKKPHAQKCFRTIFYPGGNIDIGQLK